MHRRLSLAVLFLSASLCGMGEDPKSNQETNAKGVFTALAKMVVHTAQLPSFPPEEHALDDEDADSDQSKPAQQARKRSSSGSGCINSSFVGGIGVVDVRDYLGGYVQRCFFPGEPGEGYLN